MDEKFTYEVIETISDSGKSAVFLASCPAFSEPVIVKVLRHGDLRIVERIASIESVHIPHILHYEQAGEEITVFEEYIDGEPIDEYVKNRNLRQNQIVNLILQVCEGLMLLHEQEPPIIHRDIKPSNLIVSKDGIVRLIDFDASREYKSDRSRDTQVLGTESYAPPEQYGYSQTDVRSDVYSLGVVLSELLTIGQKKVASDCEKSVEERSTSPAADDPRIPSRLRRIIGRATMFNPDARFSSVKEFAAALARDTGEQLQKKAILIALAVSAVTLILIIVVGIYVQSRMHEKLQEVGHRVTDAIGKAGETDIGDAAVTGEAAEPSEAPEDIREIMLDTYDPTLKKQVEWYFYYLSSEPSKTPLRIRSAVQQGEARQIQIRGAGGNFAENIDKKYWSEDANGFVTIDSAFLDTLEKDLKYVVTIDYTTVRLSFFLMNIERIRDAKGSMPVLNPGYSEYLRTEPRDIRLQLLNAFGRQITGLADADTGESIDATLYNYDETSGQLILRKEIFDPIPDGEYKNIRFELSGLQGISESEDPSTYVATICVRDKAYVSPKVDTKGYVVNAGAYEALNIGITWNSGKGKLESVALVTSDKESEMLREEDYEVTESGVTIRASYMKSIPAGEYKISFEFGDVAIGTHLQVNR